MHMLLQLLQPICEILCWILGLIFIVNNIPLVVKETAPTWTLITRLWLSWPVFANQFDIYIDWITVTTVTHDASLVRWPVLDRK